MHDLHQTDRQIPDQRLRSRLDESQRYRLPCRANQGKTNLARPFTYDLVPAKCFTEIITITKLSY